MPDDKDKLETARRAMEGPARTAEREAAERQEQLTARLTEIDQALKKLANDKEKLELSWINLDEQRQKLKTAAKPLLDQEKMIEEEELKIELEEAKTPRPRERHVLEEKRWLTQEKRREDEQARWAVEEKVIKLEEAIQVNTLDYQKLLEAEEKLRHEREALTKGI